MRRLKGQETSRYLGVCWDARTASWRFSIKSEGRVYTRTNFADEEQAAVCRDRLALYLHGPDAKVNFPRRKLKAASFEALTLELRKARTTSRYRGVARDDRLGRLKWLASIQVKGRPYTLGRFSTERAAAQAYDRAALHYFGQLAKLNFSKALAAPADDKALRAHARAEYKKTTASKYRGVSRHPRGWAAIIGHNYQSIHLGIFESEELAAAAYDKAARRLHGKAAKLNFR
jgi:hypothetical protein